MNIKLNQTAVFFCAVAMILQFMAGFILTAHAEGTSSMTLWCVKNGDAVENMHWQIYRVGRRERDDYVFENEFAGFCATLGDCSKPVLDWDAGTVAVVGETLKYKTIADKIEPDASGYTNSIGSVTFDGLENGLYLIWGDILKKGDTTYIPSSVFFEINGKDDAELNAYPKLVLRTLSGTVYSYTAKKIWQNDEEYSLSRPFSVTVERYRDNVFYDEIVLNEENDWTFTWTDSDDHTWFVYEKTITDNYTVSYKNNLTQYVIINTYETDTGGSEENIQTTTATVTSETYTETTQTSTSTNTGVSTDTNTHTATSTKPVRDGNTVKTTKTYLTEKTNISESQRTTTATVENDGKLPQTGHLW